MILKQIYSSDFFSSTATPLLKTLTQYLTASTSPPFHALPRHSPHELKAKALDLLNRAPGTLPAELDQADAQKRIANLADLFLTTNNPLHSPHYMGHQVSPAVPIAGFFESLGSTSNQPSGIYEMGPFPAVCERALIEKMGAYLGWSDQDFDAVGTHGGSAANLTALLAARNVHFAESWKKGVNGLKKPAIITSQDSHYSISRAAGIIGIGADAVLKCPLDSKRKVDARALVKLLDQAKAQEMDVFCIVGSSCTTPIGAFDPLDEMGRIARDHGIWFHVDAAHGGGLLLSSEHRHLLHGIEMADSVTWDAHKMMFVPALCTFLFYRNKAHSFQAFDQDAPYLFDKEQNPNLEFDSAVRTLECTKRPIGMALFLLWSTWGPGLFEALVNRTIQNAETLFELLTEARDFEPIHEPECNILCFRYLPNSLQGADLKTISDFQAKLRRHIVQSEKFYITTTKIDGIAALRVTLMNPLTERSHLEGLLEHIREVARK